MKKELENLEKKEKGKQPNSLAGPARPSQARARAPAPPDRRTPPVSGSSPSRAPSLSLSLTAQWGRPVGAGFFTCALPPSLSVSRVRFASC
jgi:hypothetical protein